MEEKQRFLHGTLEATIFHATRYVTPSLVNLIFVRGKPAYVSIKIDNQKVAETRHEVDRIWNQTFQILCAHPSDSTITITLKVNCFVLGKIHIQAHQILSKANLINGFFPLKMEKGKTNPKLILGFKLSLKPAVAEAPWSKMLSNAEFQGLQSATFPLRSNCSVILYQDAHHLSAFQPPGWSPRKSWEDIYKAIEGAKHLIYIAGWSLNPNIVLVRDHESEIPHARGVKLGELLRQKAEEGVAVRIMLWNDETSLPVIRNKGLMGTHDEDSFAYFINTKVICRLCPRLHFNLPTVFAHHQKTITVDTKVRNCGSDRGIMSFLGGFDLTDGRYDTEQHSLFQTLNKESHFDDFYQTNIAGASLCRGGPREPWHDVHACIRGEAASDVLTNFEQRWSKQCDPSLLIPIHAIPNLVHQPPASATTISNEWNWKVQVLRSIDLVSISQLSPNLTVERSIHEAHVEAIRRAERFIYIENQYFIGGCQFWANDKDCGCRNLIPVEIALKVVNKIKAKERFAVYILIPMWPEGVPDSEAVQDILHWTRETMSMMYRLIGEAIKECGEPSHPRDYLNFFCLANREEESEGEYVQSPPHPATHYWNAQKQRRFMVYVHSKLMIVDDAYLLIGSANVNQRSMDGQRDTEIAIGCYQQPTNVHEMSPRDIYAYRMSLWYEHTGLSGEPLQEPQSLECVQKMCAIGDQMWNIYSGEQVVDMAGVHLVTYPVDVTQDGLVLDLFDGGGHFPDTKTPVKGRRSMVLPPILTS